jgi:hypothetical protein
MSAYRTFPTAASPSSTSFTLLLGFGAFAAESDMLGKRRLETYPRPRLQMKEGCVANKGMGNGEPNGPRFSLQLRRK